MRFFISDCSYFFILSYTFFALLNTCAIVSLNMLNILIMVSLEMSVNLPVLFISLKVMFSLIEPEEGGVLCVFPIDFLVFLVGWMWVSLCSETPQKMEGLSWSGSFFSMHLHQMTEGRITKHCNLLSRSVALNYIVGPFIWRRSGFQDCWKLTKKGKALPPVPD